MIHSAIRLASILTLAGSIQAAEYHVATQGQDSQPGTRNAPLRTIQRAADLAQPGDTITVHRGVYREHVNPPRGGTSESARIVYRAAPGEQVEIKGSEEVKNWATVEGDVWKVVLPNSFFRGFNPFADLIRGDWFDARKRPHHTGAIYLNGHWLVEAATLDEVLGRPGAEENKPDKPVLLNIAWLRPKGATKIPAASVAARQGTRNAPCSEGGECIGWITHGDWLRYDRIDLGARTDQLEIRAASASRGGTVEVRLGEPSGELLGSCVVPRTGGWQSWETLTVPIPPRGGMQNLCLVFRDPREQALEGGRWFAEVDGANTTIWAQFQGGNPNEQQVEVNVRRAVFYPSEPGRNFVTVRGFTLRHAATPWAPPTAEQVGLIGTHWSKGWIIENNTISHSICSGIALGKHGDRFDNTSANSAEGYVKTIERAYAHPIPWTREHIGHHLVRNNHISHCEQTGIVGSLGCAFSTVTGNVIHDIHTRALFGGAEMAGIKFHGAIDVRISDNHIYRCGEVAAIWLDWMAQGAQVTGNLLHDNRARDMFCEMQHGPLLIANNLFLSPTSPMLVNAKGLALVHNLLFRPFEIIPYDARQTPFHKPRSTELAGMHDAPGGDHRFHNNLVAGPCNLAAFDSAKLPCTGAGNVFVKGARPGAFETSTLVKPDFDPLLSLQQQAGKWFLTLQFDPAWRDVKRPAVTTDLLGKAKIPGCAYDNPDGSPLSLDADYLGRKRAAGNPFPGPLDRSAAGVQTLQVWPKPRT